MTTVFRVDPNWERDPLILLNGTAFKGWLIRVHLVEPLGAKKVETVFGLIRSISEIATGDSRRGFIRQQMATSLAAFLVLGLSRNPAMVSAQTVAQDGVNAEGGRNGPGRYSRKASIESWKVRGSDDSPIVDFDHQKKTLSGAVNITFGGNGKTFASRMSRNNKTVVQVAFNGSSLSINIQGDDNVSASWNNNQERWIISNQSLQSYRRNRVDVDLAIAVAQDLDPLNRDVTNTHIQPSRIGSTRMQRQSGR